MLNKCMLIGRIGRDLELKYTQSGTAVVTLSLATNESYLDRDGNKVEKTEWHRVILFNKQAENAAKYLQKGTLIFVEGKLGTRSWKDKDGIELYTTEITCNVIKYLDNWLKEEKQQQRQRNYQQPEPREMDDCPF